MSLPFDSLAPVYNRLWTEAPEGRQQRERVWREIDGLFPPGARVLDLGCGTGDDALHLAARGVTAEGIDASAEMVALARARGVDAHVLSIVSLTAGQQYSGALSNFGVLNCVASLQPVAFVLARLLPAAAPVALCMMGRFYWRETVRGFLHFDFARVTRRLRGHAKWRGIDIRYWSAREIKQSFHPHFSLERRVSIGGGDHQLYILRRTEC